MRTLALVLTLVRWSSGLPPSCARNVTTLNVSSIAVGTDSRLGSSLASIGDIDGDGVQDIAIGMPGYRAANSLLLTNAGAVLVALMTRNGTVKDLRQFANPLPHKNDEFGTSLTAIPDLDGDGVMELVVGVPGWSGVSTGSGGLVTLLLNATAHVKSYLVTDDSWIPQLDRSHSFGVALAALDEPDAQGRPRIAVGAHECTGVGDNKGCVYICSVLGTGRPSNCVRVTGVVNQSLPVLAPSDYFGSALAVRFFVCSVVTFVADCR